MLAKVLYGIGFSKTYSDSSLFILDRDNIKIIVPMFVDDITLASKSKDKLDDFVIELGKHFKLRDLGDTTYLLGVEIMRNRREKKLFIYLIPLLTALIGLETEYAWIIHFSFNIMLKN